ncbi:RNA polymerase sigma factor [Mangrovimonas spongiae]|uniref:RNA polymerase sigma factor n=1 Tax=Mangrovimonas spongiae TaxID=2494697 RepID=A0A3R9MBS8_9FLAO|nr:RNA polymerase sigma factor [Mangrovimonas spongiae]RSK38222.1 RNA polymerase sigma factor [Mangrovimonas spongiae]
MTLTHQNIEQLIKLCKVGNQLAQLEIYNRYHKAMYNISYRIVKNDYVAEDIMQDAFLTAFTKLNSLNDINTFGAWLKRIVVNKSIYHFNKNNKYQNVPFDDVAFKIEEDSSINNNTENFTQLKAKEILKTMNSLKENYRIALTLHLIEGYDYEEICDIMNLSYANCRTTISRAKTSLRQKLEPMVN